MNPVMIVAIIGLITGSRWMLQDDNKVPAVLLLGFSGFLLVYSSIVDVLGF